MREAGEFTLHPHELTRVLDRFFLGFGDMDLFQQSMIIRPALEPRLSRDTIVKIPDLPRAIDGRVQRDVRIAVLRGPDHGFLAEHARDPDARVRLLQWHGPWVHHAMLIMRAFPTERTRLGPDLGDQIVRFLKPFPVIGRIDARGELFLPAAPDEARNQPSLGDHVDHRQLFRQPDRVIGQRQRIAENDDLRLLGHGGED